MSVIHTWELNDANPFGYRTELRRHQAELATPPAEWMPWNNRAKPARITIAQAK